LPRRSRFPLLEGRAGIGVVPLGPVETVLVVAVAVVVGLALLSLSPQEAASSPTRASGARRLTIMARPKGSGACIVV